MSAASAAARYRSVGLTTRILSASGAALTGILYEELADTLRAAQRLDALATATPRALAMIGELDAALDLAPDGDFTRAMRGIHAHAFREISLAALQNDPKRIGNALTAIQPIAEAWETVRSRA